MNEMATKDMQDRKDAPWMNWLEARLGWNETNNDKELSQYWKYVHLPFTTVRGREHAWCAMTANAALIESGYVGNGNAAAVSFVKYGTPCDYIFGAIIPIRHASGGHHVTFFHHWINEKMKIAALLGGNQSNGIRITGFNLSGNASGHDECASPRWPVKVGAGKVPA